MTVLAIRLANVQRRQQAARQGVAQDVARHLARAAAEARCRSPRHQRRPHPLWLSPDMQPARPLPRPEWRTDPTDHERLGAASSRSPTRSCGGPTSARRERLVAFWARRRSRSSSARGAAYDEVAAADEVLDPEALTIGFARRFATYKRGTLIFRDLERLAACWNTKDRPVQFIFAGKAHPADHGGKELIKAIVHFARATRRPPQGRLPRGLRHERRPLPRAGRGRLAEHPRRPLEASGTSGMKAAQRRAQPARSSTAGGSRATRPTTAGPSAAAKTTRPPPGPLETRPFRSRSSRCSTSRGVDNIPREWIGADEELHAPAGARLQHQPHGRATTPRSSTSPAFRGESLAADGLSRAVQLARTRTRSRQTWRGIRIVGVHTSGNGHFKVGDTMQVEALVDMPGIDPKDLKVQLYAARSAQPARSSSRTR